MEHNPDTEFSPYVNTKYWDLQYTAGEAFFEEEIPVPERIYDPNMKAIWVYNCEWWLSIDADISIRYAFYDTNSDGIDEMLLVRFYDEEMRTRA